jgi:hypothetical protein
MNRVIASVVWVSLLRIERRSILSTMEDFQCCGKRGLGPTMETEWAQLRITRSSCPTLYRNPCIRKQNFYIEEITPTIQIGTILKPEILIFAGFPFSMFVLCSHAIMEAKLPQRRKWV